MRQGRGRQGKVEDGKERQRKAQNTKEGRGRQVKAQKAGQGRGRQRNTGQGRAIQGKAEEGRGKRGRTRPGGAGGSVPVQGADRILPPPSSAAPLLLPPARHRDHAGDPKLLQKQCASWSELSSGKKRHMQSTGCKRDFFPLPLSWQ